MGSFQDLTGRVFVFWTVQSRSNRRDYWICRCSCGVEREVHGPNLKNGRTKSCGCRDKSGDNNALRRAARQRHGANFIGKENPWYSQASGIFSRCRLAGIELGFGSICELASYLIGIAPERCPIFGVIFSRGDAGFSPHAPTVDRIDNAMGYVKGNLQIISMRANGMKADASAAELAAFASWVLSPKEHSTAGLSAGFLY